MRNKKQWNYGTFRRISFLASGIFFAGFLLIYGLLPVFWYELTSDHTIGRIGTISFFLALLFLLIAFFLPYAKQHERTRKNANGFGIYPDQDPDGSNSPDGKINPSIFPKNRTKQAKRFSRNRRS